MLGDVYEIVDRQTLFGQEVLNVFQFRQIANFVTTLSNIAEVAKDCYIEQYLPDILEIQTNDVTHVNITVKNLFDTDDYFAEDINEVGVIGGGSPADTQSTFNAYSFTTRGSGITVKPGGKRFAGVADSFITDGVITDAGTLTKLATVGSRLGTSMTVGTIILDPIFQPILVKRVRSGVSPDYEYRMPVNEGELVYANIQNALLKLLVSSQVSRKVGIGA